MGSEAEALGALYEAMEAIDAEDFDKIRALRAPQQDVVDAFVIFGNFYRIGNYDNHNWASIKHHLSEEIY